MDSIVPDVDSVRKHGIVGMVLLVYSSKRGKFHCFTVMVRVTTLSMMQS